MRRRKEHITDVYFREEFARLAVFGFERHAWVSRSPSLGESERRVSECESVDVDDRLWMLFTDQACNVAGEFSSTP